jgi:hypothetical protein
VCVCVRERERERERARARQRYSWRPPEYFRKLCIFWWSPLKVVSLHFVSDTLILQVTVQILHFLLTVSIKFEKKKVITWHNQAWAWFIYRECRYMLLHNFLSKAHWVEVCFLSVTTIYKYTKLFLSGWFNFIISEITNVFTYFVWNVLSFDIYKLLWVFSSFNFSLLGCLLPNLLWHK